MSSATKGGYYSPTMAPAKVAHSGCPYDLSYGDDGLRPARAQYL